MSKPVVAESTALRVGFVWKSSSPGLFRSGTSRSLHAEGNTRTSIIGSQFVALMLRHLGSGFMDHNPRSTLNQKLRLGGNGVTSTFRAIARFPKLLTSGSSPS